MAGEVLEPIDRARQPGQVPEIAAERTFVLSTAVWNSSISENVLDSIRSQSRKAFEEHEAVKYIVISPRYLYISKNAKKSELFGSSHIAGELLLTYQYQGATERRAFLAEQEVLIGDVTAYWADYYQDKRISNFVIADDRAKALLMKYRPILHLHPHETSFPTTVEWYLRHVELYCMVGVEHRLVTRKVTAADLGQSLKVPLDNAKQQRVGKEKFEFEFQPHERRRFYLKLKDIGAQTRRGEVADLANVPFYGTCTVQADGVICLAYFFLYAYNGAVMDFGESGCCCCVICHNGGIHEGDWEYVVILLSPDGEKITSVRMSRHREEEGRWYTAECGERGVDEGWHTEGRRVIVYAGRESHANYNSCARHQRGCAGACFMGARGCCDDYTEVEGRVWDPIDVVMLGTRDKPLTPWTRFAGLWGRPKTQIWEVTFSPFYSYPLRLLAALVEGEGPEGPVLKGPFLGNTYPMNKSNTIPVNRQRELADRRAE